MNSLINVCEKLKFFREIHQSGERPPYIDICKLKSDRSLLSKFRLSAHSLAIVSACHVIQEKLRTNIISFQLFSIKIVYSNISLRHMSLLFNSSLPVTIKITVNFLNDSFLMRKVI